MWLDYDMIEQYYKHYEHRIRLTFVILFCLIFFFLSFSNFAIMYALTLDVHIDTHIRLWNAQSSTNIKPEVSTSHVLWYLSIDARWWWWCINGDFQRPSWMLRTPDVYPHKYSNWWDDSYYLTLYCANTSQWARPERLHYSLGDSWVVKNNRSMVKNV